MSEERIGICIPIYDHVDNKGLGTLVWSINQNSQIPFKISMGIGRNCVAKNRNKALRALPEDIRFVLMVDDDVILPYGWDTTMYGMLLRYRDFGVISATMMGPRGEAQNDLHPEAFEVGTELVERKILPGTCFMYDRARTPIVFDENYEGSQWEDTDAMMQVHQMGKKTGVTPLVQIIHANNWSENKYWGQNKALFEAKWGKV